MASPDTQAEPAPVQPAGRLEEEHTAFPGRPRFMHSEPPQLAHGGAAKPRAAAASCAHLPASLGGCFPRPSL